MRASKRLIVNADGFGFGAGATQGVLDAIRKGQFISSVSVNANFPEAERIRELVARFPWVSVGVHLNPAVGRPCLPSERVPTLVNHEGFFHGRNFLPLLRKGAISRRELEAEFDAQIRGVKNLVGDRLTHLDSQEHQHLCYLGLFLALARKWKIDRMRNNASLICLESRLPGYSRCKVYLSRPHVWLAHRYRRYQMRRARALGMRLADYLVTIGYAGTGNKTDLDNWLRVLHNLPQGTYEVFCHPAYPDATLRRWSGYCDQRASELEILSHPILRNAARELGVQIISFKEL